MESANIITEMLITYFDISPHETENAVITSSVPSPERGTPDVKITIAVKVHITTVSKKTSKSPSVPCAAGDIASAPACAIGAVPPPASFEKAPLPTPCFTASENRNPKTPPDIASFPSADEKMLSIAEEMYSLRYTKA